MAVQIDAVAEIQKTFQLLFQRKNWMLALPILVGGAVAVVVAGIVGMLAFGSLMTGGLAGAMATGDNSRGAGGLFALLFSGLGLLFLVACVVAVIAGMFGYAWAYAAAEPVWQGGDPDIGGGFSKAMAKLPQLIVLGLILGVVFLFLGWTLIVPLAVFLFCAYALPYIIQGNESATGAISASINLAKNNLGPTAMLLLAIVVISFVVGLVGAIPILGWIVQIVGAPLVGAFNILAIMRWYNLLTGTPAASAPATTT
jgi:hypothetical protein